MFISKWRATAERPLPSHISGGLEAPQSPQRGNPRTVSQRCRRVSRTHSDWRTPKGRCSGNHKKFWEIFLFGNPQAWIVRKFYASREASINKVLPCVVGTFTTVFLLNTSSLSTTSIAIVSPGPKVFSNNLVANRFSTSR
ncbi:hypothetical protein NUACC26_015160 [Scytonema sp. NUACC26]